VAEALDRSRQELIEGSERVFAKVLIVGLVSVVLGALEPATGAAATVELGVTGAPVTVPCQNMIATNSCARLLANVTAVQTTSGGVPSPMKVTHAGRLVAFTVGLADLSQAQLQNLLHAYGGAWPGVEITVLRPVRVGGQHEWRVAAHSRSYPVLAYLGTVKRIRLHPALPLSRGEVIALTTATWAPALTSGLAAPQFRWRASQPSNHTDCTEPALYVPELTIGATNQFPCLYGGQRVEYSATEVEQ
jgi:hypothetical protein